MSLDEQLALFEQEIASLTEETPDPEQTSVLKNEANFVVIDTPAPKYVKNQQINNKSEKVFGTHFVPNQVRSKNESNATISEAPALYNIGKSSSKSSSSKSSSSHSVLEKPPEPPQTLSALPYVCL
uniref:RNA-binding protein 42 n=1 Tax=Panagrolaimus sp. ES5 TaxID=591445 RepID=A0AC34GVB3_9BILA